MKKIHRMPVHAAGAELSVQHDPHREGDKYRGGQNSERVGFVWQ
ncbi:MAG TPA: hypothetical protein PLM89_07220 [Anaerolineales bacterium]|nr:hypothetical protein [Anaerolineales bacterium]